MQNDCTEDSELVCGLGVLWLIFSFFFSVIWQNGSFFLFWLLFFDFGFLCYNIDAISGELEEQLKRFSRF